MGLGWPEVEEEEDFCYAHAGDCVQLGGGRGRGEGALDNNERFVRPPRRRIAIWATIQFRLSLPDF